MKNCRHVVFLPLTSVHRWDCWPKPATNLHNDPNSLHVAPAKHRRTGGSKGRHAEWQAPASQIKQKSESNRPRDHVAEGSRPGALPILLKATPSAEQAVLFHQNLRQPTLSGQDGLVICRVTWKSTHRSPVNKGKAQRKRWLPSLITIVLCWRTQKQR